MDLPESPQFVRVKIDSVEQIGSRSVRACVVKDAGDDPDVTNGCRIQVELSRCVDHGVHFLAGEGVGTITKPGFALPVGEPAINPVPRKMVEQTLACVLAEHGIREAQGWQVRVSCTNGEALARKTYNPRLGIVGGISILGTKGIVEPKSLDSWLASIQLYVRIALADQAREVVLAPGNIGQAFAEQELGLPSERVVQMANFVGFTVDEIEKELGAQSRTLPQLWVVGHPGKLAKLLENQWDTHSGVSPMAMRGVSRVVAEFGYPQKLVEQCQQATTVERIIQLLRAVPGTERVWVEIEKRVQRSLKTRLPSVQKIHVVMFDMKKQRVITPVAESVYA